MKALQVAALAALIVSCSDTDQTAPQQQALTTNELTFFRFDAGAFVAAQKSGSFWAVPGQSRSLVLRYNDTNAEFLRFEVGPNSLTGSDSVQISVEVDANGDFAFHFAPSGLQFNNFSPATLRIDHARANSDIDADGDVDFSDRLLTMKGGIWKRELPLLPWLKIPSINILNTTEQAKVYDFTSFGMAVD
jgi:hypothetical protein